MRRVGSFEGKTHFSALVEAAEHGETIVITRKGRPVAQLGPLAEGNSEGTRDALARILARRIRIGVPAKELIAAGRRR